MLACSRGTQGARQPGDTAAGLSHLPHKLGGDGELDAHHPACDGVQGGLQVQRGEGLHTGGNLVTWTQQQQQQQQQQQDA
jgi:hypothetical protein